MKTCIICGCEFESKAYNAKICSDECRKIYRANHQRRYYQRHREEYVQYARDPRKEVQPILTDKREAYNKARSGKGRLYARIRAKKPNYCAICKATGRLALHHINLIPDDDREENLIQLCYTCHKRVHSGVLKLQTNNIG